MPYTKTVYVDNGSPPIDASNLNKVEDQVEDLTNIVESYKIDYVADTGSVNAYVATLSPALSAYSDGASLKVKIVNTNTTISPTLNVNTLGAKTIYKTDGSSLYAGDLKANTIYTFTYNSTLNGFTANIQSSSGWVRQASAPANTQLLWTDSANGDVLKYYNGSAWVVVPNVWS